MEETININSRIIDKCLEGDIKAQFQLYKQYSKAMYNVAIRLLSNKMDAEDILQESFITAFQKMGELQNKNAGLGWIIYVMHIWLNGSCPFRVVFCRPESRPEGLFSP